MALFFVSGDRGLGASAGKFVVRTRSSAAIDLRTRVGRVPMTHGGAVSGVTISTGAQRRATFFAR
jgi:hypothetical protein